MLTEQEFRRLLATYGADIGRWPEPVRDAAAALAGRADLLAARQAEAGFDRLLRTVTPEVAEARLDQQLARLSRAVVQAEEATDDGWALFAFMRSGAWLPQGAAYAGLFLAGCLGNLLARASLSFSPLELWMFNSTTMPFGG